MASGVRDNFDEEERLNDLFLGGGLERMLRRLLTFANTRIVAISQSKYMQDAGFAAGLRGARRPRGMSGPIRIVTGRLFRGVGMRFSARAGGSREGSVRIEINKKGTAAKLIKTVSTPYAAVHEEGYSGTVRVPEHERTITQAFGRPVATRRVRVRAHDRTMHIKKRPYLGPALEEAVPSIQAEGARELVATIKNPNR